MDLLWLDTNKQKASVSPFLALAISSVSAGAAIAIRLNLTLALDPRLAGQLEMINDSCSEG